MNEDKSITSDEDVQPIDINTTSPRLQAEKIFLTTSVIHEGELSSAGVKVMLVTTMESCNPLSNI